MDGRTRRRAGLGSRARSWTRPRRHPPHTLASSLCVRVHRRVGGVPRPRRTRAFIGRPLAPRRRHHRAARESIYFFSDFWTLTPIAVAAVVVPPSSPPPQQQQQPSRNDYGRRPDGQQRVWQRVIVSERRSRVSITMSLSGIRLMYLLLFNS